MENWKKKKTRQNKMPNKTRGNRRITRHLFKKKTLNKKPKENVTKPKNKNIRKGKQQNPKKKNT